MRRGTHGFVRRDRDVDRRAVADGLAAGGRGFAVEDGGEEDGAALAVKVEHLRRVRREAEAVLLGPDRDVGPAALEHGDVERVDAHFLQHLCRRWSGWRRNASGVELARRLRLAG